MDRGRSSDHDTGDQESVFLFYCSPFACHVAGTICNGGHRLIGEHLNGVGRLELENVSGIPLRLLQGLRQYCVHFLGVTQHALEIQSVNFSPFKPPFVVSGSGPSRQKIRKYLWNHKMCPPVDPPFYFIFLTNNSVRWGGGVCTVFMKKPL